MRLVALGLCVAAIAAPAAFAKGRISVTLGDSTPRVGQSFTVYVRTDYVVPPNDWLRLIAVAPNKNWYDVVGAVTGDSSIAQANIPHDGFEIRLVRTAPKSARGCPAAASRPLAAVVPKGTHLGFMLPPPTAWMPWSRFTARRG